MLAVIGALKKKVAATLINDSELATEYAGFRRAYQSVSSPSPYSPAMVS